MVSRLKSFVRAIIGVELHERKKLFYLTLAFFFIIGAYTLVKDLKDAIFINLVGLDYVPRAQLATMFILVPAILFYSKLVDNIRRYQLLCIYSFAFGILGLLFAYLVGHPTMGMANTEASAWRIFGWIFYFFGEGYSPFVVGVFWAFANSVNSPEEAKSNYGLLAAGSKVGGMLSAGCAWFLLSPSASTKQLLFSDTTNYQLLLAIASGLLLMVPVVIILLMKNVPGKFLHGYEAAYQVEKERSKSGKADTGVFAGLSLLLRFPYVFGIFGMVFFYEVVAKVLSFLRLGIAQKDANSASEVLLYLFQMTFFMHAIGFMLSLFGTRALLHRFGERICLLLIPLGTGLVLLYFLLTYDKNALIVAVVGTKVINYAFSWPVREGLYIPTTKEIKFKSKSWIDAFGSKFAKSSGSLFNELSKSWASTSLAPALSVFFGSVTILWFITAFALGMSFDTAVASNKVIGSEE
jgi:AAA family ATP:ADP antiporter